MRPALEGPATNPPSKGETAQLWAAELQAIGQCLAQFGGNPVDAKRKSNGPDQPAVDPTGRPGPDDERPEGETIEELNRQTGPKGPDGRPVDPAQEQDPDTAG